MAFAASTFCCKPSFVDAGESCFCFNRFKMPPRILSSTFPKQYNLFLGTGSPPPNRRTKLQMGKSSLFAKSSRLLSLRACRLTSEDSEGLVSGESVLLDEQTLTRELQIAVEEENYAEAAKIRDSLRVLKEDSKASVLAANARFYNAFRKGDLAAMQALWARGENVCCVHPGASGVLGYDDVMESWEVVWMNYDFPLEIELKNIRVHFRGDVGYVTCVEFIRTKGSSWGAQFVTNVFERIDGQWFICIHHASPVDL